MFKSTEGPDAADYYIQRDDGLYYRDNFCGYTHTLYDAGRYTKAVAENVVVGRFNLRCGPFVESDPPRVICAGCGSNWVLGDLRAARLYNSALLSCCPEREALNIEQWKERADRFERRCRAYEEALSPGPNTKAEYIGDIYDHDARYDRKLKRWTISWSAQKDFMKSIREYVSKLTS